MLPIRRAPIIFLTLFLILIHFASPGRADYFSDQVALAKRLGVPTHALPIFLKNTSPHQAAWGGDKQSQKGVLLIHGFTANPHEVYDLARYLHREGFTVLTVRLAGHGTRLEDLRSVTRRDWYSDVNTAYKFLRTKAGKIYGIGLSTGALLLIHLASIDKVNGIVLVSPIVQFSNRQANLVPWIVPVAKLFRVDPGIKEYSEETRDLVNNYRGFPIIALNEVFSLIKDGKAGAKKVTVPALILHSKLDDTADIKGAEWLYNNIGSKQKTLVIFDKHLPAIAKGYVHIFTKKERDALPAFEQIKNFLGKY